MKRKTEIPVDLAGIVDRKIKQAREESMFLTRVAALHDLLRYDTICGSWMAEETPRSLLIRKQGNVYMLLLCDLSRCYKSIIRELMAVPSGRKLLLYEDAQEEPVGEVVYQPESDTLTCGSYGQFRAEDRILIDELQDQMNFALRNEDGYVEA